MSTERLILALRGDQDRLERKLLDSQAKNGWSMAFKVVAVNGYVGTGAFLVASGVTSGNNNYGTAALLSLAVAVVCTAIGIGLEP